MAALASYRQTGNSAAHMAFEVFRDQDGHWCARRTDGKVCGTFLERDAAMRFARRAW